MTREEFIGKLRSIYVGEENAIDEIISEYDRLKQNYERIYNENCKLRQEHNISDIGLLDEIDRLNNIKNKTKKYIEDRLTIENEEYYLTHTFDKDNVKELYDILRGEKE